MVQRGSGPTPVVLIAGLGAGWSILERLIRDNEAHYRFYAVSLAGYGGSSAPPMPPEGASYEERTWLSAAERAVGELIDREALDRPIIAAFYSDAANIAIHFAAAHPERVGGVLVLSSSARFPLPTGVPRGPALDRFADQWFKTVTEIMWPSGMFPPEFYSTTEDVAEKAWWDVLEPSIPTLVRYTVETWADDLVPVAATLQVPTIVLSPGFDDAFLTGSNAELVRPRFYDSWAAAVEEGAELQHRIVDGARMLIWEDRPAAVSEALRELSGGR